MKVIDQLHLYRARAMELRNSQIIRKGFNPGITINWNKMQGLRFISKQPDETSLKAFLMTFRHFISQKEPIFINKVYNLCQKYLISDKLKEYLVKSRKVWKNSLKSTGIIMVYNKRELTPEFITDLWINGYYFHSDLKKLTILNRILPHERMLIRFQFLNFLLDATRQVLYVDNIIKVALRENLFKF